MLSRLAAGEDACGGTWCSEGRVAAGGLVTVCDKVVLAVSGQVYS